jgi:hypothetical protein
VTRLVALLIFAALAAASWYVCVACYRSTFPDGPDPAAAPNYRVISFWVIAAVGVTGLMPFPVGYVAGVIAWASAVFGFLELPAGRAAVLTGYLAVASVVTRLVILGVLDVV